MTKVITYGTYDLLHHGHIRLLERAKALGDYLIVGVTSEDFDRGRGKINVQQTLMERIAALEATGIPDQIVVEEYEGQKIDDIQRYGVDVFTVGSDWVGYFDYLNEYCKVIYLDRTQGVSSTQLRSQKRELSIGLVGNREDNILAKYYREFAFVNGAFVNALCTQNDELIADLGEHIPLVTDNYDDLLQHCDAVYLVSDPEKHYEHVKQALLAGKHVLCESPIALNSVQTEELFALAAQRKLVLMDALKTAYAMAYNRLILLCKSGRIGKVVSIDVTCTSLRDDVVKGLNLDGVWNSMCAWGPTALLPVFHILGTDYLESRMYSRVSAEYSNFDLFTKIDLTYPEAVATIKVGRGVKSEGDLVISGTKGYVYVPAPWWKTDYFELRYENQNENQRYFYKLDGEGIRYELVAFLKAIESASTENNYLEHSISTTISAMVDKFYQGDFTTL